MSPGPCDRPAGARGVQHPRKSIAPVAVSELAVSWLRIDKYLYCMRNLYSTDKLYSNSQNSEP